MEYPILGDRPINKWKVVELKEELKRRNLTIKGLKDDLVNRLHEALRSEREDFEGGASDSVGFKPELPQSNSNDEELAGDTWNPNRHGTAKADEVVSGVSNDNAPFEADDGEVGEEAIGSIGSVEISVGEHVSDISKTVRVDKVVAEVSLDDVPSEVDQEKLQEKATGGIDSVEMNVEEPGLEVSVEASIRTDEVAVPETIVIERENLGLNLSVRDADIVEEPAALEASAGTSVMVDEIAITQMQMSEKAMQNDETKMENKYSKPLQINAKSDQSDLNNQVYEVSPDLGFQVNSESISTDTVSVCRNDELKLNLNPDNVHLELNAFRPEMVQPSISDGPLNSVDLYLLDDSKPDENQGFVEETDHNISTPVDFTKKNDATGGGSSPMISLDHNLVDESMGGGVLENKQIDLKHSLNNVGNKIEPINVPIRECGSSDVAVRDDYSPVEVENVAAITAGTEEKSFKDDIQSTPMELSEKNYTDVPIGKGGSFDDAVRADFSPDKAETFLAVTEEKSFQVDVEPTLTGDEGRLEKINLDHSSGDDSMEEDVLEKKQNDSNHNSTEVAEKIVLTEALNVEVDAIIDAVGPDLSPDKLESPSDKKDDLSAAQKRKSEDEAAGSKEPPKRQRRWNSESLDIPETQSSDLSLSAAHNDLLQKQKLTRSDSTLSGDAPKERVVPPSPKPPTDSLRIDHFLRPFTLKAVQELLARTGKVCSFWMDQIKTHCYVTYSTVEEAIETRNALYNLQWPPNGGRLLVAKFVDPQEVKLRLEAPPQSPSTPVSTVPSVPETRALAQPPSSANQRGPKQQGLSQTPTVSDPIKTKERVSVPPTPSLSEKVEPPMVTLDELFRRTRATPRIYYLPLTDEQVAAKLAVQREKKQ